MLHVITSARTQDSSFTWFRVVSGVSMTLQILSPQSFECCGRQHRASPAVATVQFTVFTAVVSQSTYKCLCTGKVLKNKNNSMQQAGSHTINLTLYLSFCCRFTFVFLLLASLAKCHFFLTFSCYMSDSLNIAIYSKAILVNQIQWHTTTIMLTECWSQMLLQHFMVM